MADDGWDTARFLLKGHIVAIRPMFCQVLSMAVLVLLYFVF